MFDTALTLFGTPVTWLEVLAFVLALANIACNVFEIHWGWPLTVVASALYAWLFFTSKLYGEAGVNVFFAVTAVWGWSQWLKGQYDDGEAPLVIRRLTQRGIAYATAAWAVLWVVCAALLHSITDSDVVWADGFVTAGSIVGTFLLGRKFIANWLVWLLVNAASIALFAYKGLTLTVVLYAIFFGLAIWGWVGWQRRMTLTLRVPAHGPDQA
ncbi:MAG: transporter [Burkholderiales bacterium PBB3]|nr:MAG: transporter [Burkholderiales bacterium PBB3]